MKSSKQTKKQIMAKNPSMPDKPARFAAFERKHKDVFNACEKMGMPSMMAAMTWIEDILGES